MRKTSLFALAPALIAAAAMSAPVQAQTYNQNRDYNHNGYNHNDGRHQSAWQITPARNAQIRSDINGLRQAINRAEQRRTISPREATSLENQARDIQRAYASYARGGLTQNEVRNLEQRVNSVRIALRMERRDWDGRRG